MKGTKRIKKLQVFTISVLTNPHKPANNMPILAVKEAGKEVNDMEEVKLGNSQVVEGNVEKTEVDEVRKDNAQDVETKVDTQVVSPNNDTQVESVPETQSVKPEELSTDLIIITDEKSFKDKVSEILKLLRNHVDSEGEKLLNILEEILSKYPYPYPHPAEKQCSVDDATMEWVKNEIDSIRKELIDSINQNKVNLDDFVKREELGKFATKDELNEIRNILDSLIPVRKGVEKVLKEDWEKLKPYDRLLKLLER